MRPIEVWRDAKEANAATYAECFHTARRSSWADDADQAVVAIIEADRLAVRADERAKVVAEIVAELRDQWDRGELVCGDELADLIEAKFGGGDA